MQYGSYRSTVPDNGSQVIDAIRDPENVLLLVQGHVHENTGRRLQFGTSEFQNSSYRPGARNQSQR